MSSNAPARTSPDRAASRGAYLAAILAAAGAAVLFIAGEWLAAVVALAAVPLVLVATRRAEMTRVHPVPDVARAPIDGLSAARLLEAVGDPLLLYDRAGVVVEANRAARDAFGERLVGLDLQVRFRAPEMQELVRSMLGGQGSTIDYAERLPIERVFRVSTTAVNDDTGLFLLAFKDQSEARRIDRMRADFIANASHELRTPLASVAGFIDTLRGPARDDAAARDRFLGIMQEQTARMARLIDDLLSLSRLEMKPQVGRSERADVVGIVGSVADALSRMADEAGVVVERNLPAEPVSVPGSRDELTQVFENLLENAIKYGRAGKRVVVSVRRAEGGAHPGVEIAFRDFGPGIAAEHIPRVTERFYRVEAGSGATPKGTGLGLAIVKHILTRHNGRLSIRSEPGAGAEFVAHLPL